MLEFKNIQERKFVLGQFFTPPSICKDIVARLVLQPTDIIIEPSFGTGNFLSAMASLPQRKIGFELDADVFAHCPSIPNSDLHRMDFYDFTIKTKNRLIFIGNPPFRTPAYSLRTHKEFISRLTQKYDVLGIREEAIFFVLHSIDLIRQNDVEGELHYILPTTVLKNNSKFFTRFKQFILENCKILRIDTIDALAFDGVIQDLVCLSLKVPRLQKANYGELFATHVEPKQTKYTAPVDGVETDMEEYLCLTDDGEIPFQRIFKRTYLGSVPCESLLMSVAKEPLEHFMERLCAIIGDTGLTIDTLYDRLQYHGTFHLKVFSQSRSSDAVQKKLEIILSYVRNIQEKEGILKSFQDPGNYKKITVRDGGTRFYFRCERLKRGKNFVYELNPNPCKSFYFTGNPSHSSTDYFGFCDYDINRNVSPGANRTVPVDGLEDNLTDEFKSWWRHNTSEPFAAVFDYLIYISKTPWYKTKKRNNKRFYFAIPKTFIPLSQRQPSN